MCERECVMLKIKSAPLAVLAAVMALGACAGDTRDVTRQNKHIHETSNIGGDYAALSCMELDLVAKSYARRSQALADVESAALQERRRLIGVQLTQIAETRAAKGCATG